VRSGSEPTGRGPPPFGSGNSVISRHVGRGAGPTRYVQSSGNKPAHGNGTDGTAEQRPAPLKAHSRAARSGFFARSSKARASHFRRSPKLTQDGGCRTSSRCLRQVAGSWIDPRGTGRGFELLTRSNPPGEKPDGPRARARPAAAGRFPDDLSPTTWNDGYPRRGAWGRRLTKRGFRVRAWHSAPGRGFSPPPGNPRRVRRPAIWIRPGRGLIPRPVAMAQGHLLARSSARSKLRRGRGRRGHGRDWPCRLKVRAWPWRQALDQLGRDGPPHLAQAAHLAEEPGRSCDPAMDAPRWRGDRGRLRASCQDKPMLVDAVDQGCRRRSKEKRRAPDSMSLPPRGLGRSLLWPSSIPLWARGGGRGGGPGASGEV